MALSPLPAFYLMLAQCPQKVTTNLAASALASGDSLMADRVSLALFCAKSSWVFCCPEGDEH